MDVLAWEVCKGLQPHFSAVLAAILETAEEEAVQRRWEHQRCVADRSAGREKKDVDGKSRGEGCGAVGKDAWWSSVSLPHWDEGWISLDGCVDAINRVQQRWEEEHDRAAMKTRTTVPMASTRVGSHTARSTRPARHTETTGRSWEGIERQTGETNLHPRPAKQVRMTRRLCEYITRRFGRPSFSVPPWMGEHSHPEHADLIRLWPEPLRKEEYRVGKKYLSSTSQERPFSSSRRTPYGACGIPFHGDDRHHFFFPDGNATEWTPVLNVGTLMAAMGTALETFPKKK